MVTLRHMWLVLLLVRFQGASGGPMLVVTADTVEHVQRPLSVSAIHCCRFTWYTTDPSDSGARGWHQTQYEVSISLMDGTLVHTSGHEGNVSVVELYDELAGQLHPSTSYQWQVSAVLTDHSGSTFTAHSKPAYFATMPELSATDAIGTEFNKSECPWCRYEFDMPAALMKVHADASFMFSVASAGFHEAYVNGRPVTSAILNPSVSDLARRVLVRTYNVTTFMTSGRNALGLWLAPGWAMFDSVNPAVDNLFNLSQYPVVVAELRALHGNDTSTRIAVTSTSWHCSLSDTTHRGRWRNSDFGGDRVDTGKSVPASSWATAGYDQRSWQPAVSLPKALSSHKFTGELLEPNGLRDLVYPKTIDRELNGDIHIVMERVFTGWVELINLRGEPNATVLIQSSSVLTKDVEYNMVHEVTLNASGHLHTFRPRFSYHESLLLVISGLESLGGIVGHRIGNIAHLNGPRQDPSMGRKPIATFQSSDHALNRLYNVSMWTMANLVTGGISVDCPHRERLGYIGDAHTTLEFALANVASGAFYRKWILDIIDIQGYPAHTAGAPSPQGYIPHTAPTIDGGGGPGWSGFVVVMPWELYRTYEDLEILRLAFPHMQTLVEFWFQMLDQGLIRPWGTDKWAFLGDWLTPHGSEPSTSEEALLFNNCYINYCLGLVAKVAAILNEFDQAEKYRVMSKALGEAIHRKFYKSETSGYIDTRQGHLVMPLISGVVPEEEFDNVQQRLMAEIRNVQEGHIDTGLHGTYFLFKWLTDRSIGAGGSDELAYLMATNPSPPGYASILSAGYQTWPEAWGTCADKVPPANPYKCKSWTTGSASPSHGTLNGIGMWYIGSLGGIRRPSGGVGYQKVVFQPAFNLTQAPLSVNASYQSLYGVYCSSWSWDGHVLHYNVSVPVNCDAEVYLPATRASDVEESGQLATSKPGITYLRQDTKTIAVFSVLSGHYFFKSAIQAA